MSLAQFVVGMIVVVVSVLVYLGYDKLRRRRIYREIARIEEDVREGRG